MYGGVSAYKNNTETKKYCLIKHNDLTEHIHKQAV